MAIATPIILGTMAQLMMQAPGSLIAKFDVPRDVVHAAYRDNPRITRRPRSQSAR